jgi:hypothetical protein
VTSANNFFCFGNGTNHVFAANASTGNMVLGNGSGQITIKGDLYVTGTIYSSAGTVSSSGQNTSIDTVDEIKGTSKSPIRLNNNDNDNNFSVAKNDTNEVKTTNNETIDEEDSQETLFSYTPPEKIRETNINKSNQSINTESFDAIDVRLTSIDQSLIGLGTRIDGLDTRVSTLEQSIISTVVAMEDGFAMSAAIAARPTPNSLGWSFTAGAGNYGSSNALSAGFIYVDPNYAVSINFAEAEGSSKNMTNIGVSYNLTNLFGKK